MIRNVKYLVLAGLVVFAVASAVSPAASPEGELHAETEDTRITGSTGKTEQHTFTMRVGKLLYATFVCGVSTFEGTTSAKTSSELTVTPKYENCHTESPETPVGVNMNGCAYLITFQGSNPVEGVIHLECEPAATIEITVLKCTFTIHPQTVSGVTFKNTGAGMSRDVDMIEKGMVFVTTAKGATCEGGGTGELNGSTTMTGEGAGGEPMGIWTE